MKGAARRQFIQDALAEPMVCLQPVFHALAPDAAGHIPLSHLRPEDSVVVCQHDRRGMGPILEQLPVLPEQGAQVIRIVDAEAAKWDQQLRSGDGVDRVDLQASDAANRLKQIGFCRVGFRRFEFLDSYGQTACFLQAKVAHRHGANANRTCVSLQRPVAQTFLSAF